MKNKQYMSLFILAAALQACSSDAGSSSGKCQCGDDEKCYEDVCYPVDACKPDCTGTDKCYKGQCIKQDQCAPDCKEDEKCYQGSCYALDVCKPDCTEGYECVDGSCQLIDPTKCTGTQCKSSTEYCDDTGHWAECASGTGCHLGYCIEGLAPECKDGECHESENKKCSGGKWQACGSLEQCDNGDCVITDEVCEVGTCSGDNQYRCTAEAKFEKCDVGSECNKGECIETFNKIDAMLYQTCTKNSDCAFGACIFELSTSSPFTNESLGLANVNYVPIHLLDSRLEEGMGICTADCTQDANACNTLTEESSSVKFTCQLMVASDSPYPPKDKDGNSLTLPFQAYLDLEKMNNVSYAAACRPNDAGEYYYSKKFCKSCAISDDCGTNEVCHLGMCLNVCSSSDMCPIGFSCTSLSNSDLSVCVPQTHTCGDCADVDGDGRGYGHCDNSAFDCNDLDPKVYYTTDLPLTCSSTDDDKNCNGAIDRYEVLGTAENCTACGDTCKAATDAQNYTRMCVHVDAEGYEDGKVADPMDLDSYRFTCKGTCEPGWADCDGNPDNGCEIQIAVSETITDAEGNKIVNWRAAANGTVWSKDEDNDKYGSTDGYYQYFCCSSQADVCYAPGNAYFNPKNYWNALDNDKILDSCTTPVDPTTGAGGDPIRDCVKKINVANNILDCNDNNNMINPDIPDICDNIDNDCNPATADGSANRFDEKTLTTYAPDASISKDAKSLNDECNVYTKSKNSSDLIKCGAVGTVECLGDDKKLICHASKNEGTKDGWDATTQKPDFNGFDDNCNGLVDEDGMVPCIITGNLDYATYAAGVTDTSLYKYFVSSAGYESTLNAAAANSKDRSLSLCRIGKLVYNATQNKPMCKPLYEPRPYDFYGDGIDADCDGLDYDLDKAVFVTLGSMDNNNCTSSSPCVKLETAVTKMKNLRDTYGFYPDIIMDKRSATSETSTIVLPNYIKPSNALGLADDPILSYKAILAEDGYTVVYPHIDNDSDDNIKSIYDLHKVLAQRSAAYPSFKPNKYLFAPMKATAVSGADGVTYTYAQDPNFERNQPEETVRIYGGFDRSSGWSSYSGSKTSVKATLTINSLFKAALKPSSDDTPLNLKLSNLDIVVNANPLSSSYATGATLVGIQANPMGSTVILNNTTLTVNAPEGYSYTTARDKANEGKTGHNGKGQSGYSIYGIHEKSYNKSCGKDTINYKYGDDTWYTDEVNQTNDCRYEYNETSYGTYNAAAGGTGAYHDNGGNGNWYGARGCGSQTAFTYKMGNNTHTVAYAKAGDGSPSSWKSTGKSSGSENHRVCGNLNLTEKSGDEAGRPGYTGRTGDSGDSSLITMNYKTITNSANQVTGIYVSSNKTNAIGEPGQPGGGGGGGSVRRCYTSKGTIRCTGGSGGNGGCGGYGGFAGGTGGSAIGIFMRSHDDSNYNTVQFVNNSKVTAKNGQAGKAQNGGQGGDGGASGMGHEHTWSENGACAATTLAGGPGGGGGGGGAGAPGRPGLAFPFLLSCAQVNPPYSFTDSLVTAESLATCGFKIEKVAPPSKFGSSASSQTYPADTIFEGAASYTAQNCTAKTYSKPTYSMDEQGYASQDSALITTTNYLGATTFSPSDIDAKQVYCAKEDACYYSPKCRIRIYGRNGMKASTSLTSYHQPGCYYEEDESPIYFKTIVESEISSMKSF